MKRNGSSSRFRQSITTVLYPLFFGILILVLWQTQALHAMLNIDPFVLPLPSRINSIIGESLPKIMTNVWATLIVAVAGLLLGSLFGYLIAIVATVFPKWGAGGLSIVTAFNAIPIVALAPVITNWTKDVSSDANIRSMVAKIIVVLLMCTASMSLNAYRGLTELRPFSQDLLESYAAGKFTIFRKLRLPNSVPYIFTALRVSVPLSVISALVSEYFAEYVIGVGRQIRENIVLGQYPTAWAYITVACLIGIVMYAVLIVCESILLRHRK
ncbi:MAG: transporter permease subunit [Oscillospiraceae bacterium]|nr:transporter permease subunit [Oscillospiraceae bacterium]